jgi:hypothetical protein
MGRGLADETAQRTSLPQALLYGRGLVLPGHARLGRRAPRARDQAGADGSLPVVELLNDGSRVESWFSDGVLHRPDGPARRQTTHDGICTVEWYCLGRRHRTGGPAYVRTRPDGARTEAWFFLGMPQEAESAQEADADATSERRRRSKSGKATMQGPGLSGRTNANNWPGPATNPTSDN